MENISQLERKIKRYQAVIKIVAMLHIVLFVATLLLLAVFKRH
jgi:predicted neutral ceramidase superfamily lipid hydrolase